MSVIKFETLTAHFEKLLAESKARIAYNEMMFHAKKGHESQLQFFINIFGSDTDSDTIAVDELLLMLERMLAESKATELTFEVFKVELQNSQAALEKFIEDVKSGLFQE